MGEYRPGLAPRPGGTRPLPHEAAAQWGSTAEGREGAAPTGAEDHAKTLKAHPPSDRP